MAIIHTGDKGEYDREVTVDKTVAVQPWRWSAVKIPVKFPKIMPAKWVVKNCCGSWARGETIWFFLDKEDAAAFKERWL